MQHPSPRSADLVSPFTFRIEWKTGVVHALTARELRLSCPCAACVDEHSGAPLLDPAGVPEDVHPVSLALVGHYAVQPVFSDGHNTGIFSFEYLRSLCPCPECAAGRPR